MLYIHCTIAYYKSIDHSWASDLFSQKCLFSPTICNFAFITWTGMLSHVRNLLITDNEKQFLEPIFSEYILYNSFVTHCAISYALQIVPKWIASTYTGRVPQTYIYMSRLQELGLSRDNYWT